MLDPEMTNNLLVQSYPFTGKKKKERARTGKRKGFTFIIIDYSLIIH